MKDEILVGRLYITYAQALFQSGMLESCIDFAEKGLSIAKKKNNPALLRSASTVVGNLYLLNGLPEKSLAHLRRAWELSKMRDLSFYRSSNAYMLGTNLLVLGKKDSALAYIQNGLGLARAAKDSISLSRGYTALTFYHQNTGDLNKWKSALDEGIKLSKAISNFQTYIALSCNLTAFYVQIKSYQQAITLGQTLERELASKNIPYSKVYLYELMYNASKGIGVLSLPPYSDQQPR